MGKFLALGEIMLRISNEAGTRMFSEPALKSYLGGGEANVAYSIAQYGVPTKYASIVPANPLGDSVLNTLGAVGVDVTEVYQDGPRLGTYYLELGSGARGAKAFYDRAYSSFALTEKLPWNFDELFADVEIFHLSGIVGALSPAWLENVMLLLAEAKKRGITISFDSNYRAKLWSPQAAGNALKRILPQVDILSAGVKDAKYLLELDGIDLDDVAGAYEKYLQAFPNLKMIYSTTRTVISSEHNQLLGTLYLDGKLYQSQLHDIKPIVDRIGGGDAYAAGMLAQYYKKQDPQAMVEFATAASHLKHTILGDMNQFNEKEVLDFMQSGGDVSR
ncbi:MAG: sugar kinase [Lactobacillaceae bacterium]|jgi:2-dehydro-3-deoxygluconokinase|nr:sugar kinase [Lactobacillaceae bacterium]